MEENCLLKLDINNAKILTSRLLEIDNCKYCFYTLLQICYYFIMPLFLFMLGPHLYESEESLDLIQNVEELVRLNKELKDRNDELEMNMLSIPFEDW